MHSSISREEEEERIYFIRDLTQIFKSEDGHMYRGKCAKGERGGVEEEMDHFSLCFFHSHLSFDSRDEIKSEKR